MIAKSTVYKFWLGIGIVNIKKHYTMENSAQLKFFIVDDDIFCANLHEHYLLNLNYTDITYFSNGNDCLNNLDQRPDVIFLDHNMEDITGFEVLKKIKRLNPNIYVVMISGQENIKTAVDALKYGAFDYIVKDNMVSEKMNLIISKIIKVKEELKKSNPTVIRRFLSIF
jgi:DNA-binding NtrC family response regulator